MFTPELVEVLKSQSATIENQSVLHFGSPVEELNSLESHSVVCPVHNWMRIRATGSDRAKFLHNFCTNDIKGLAAGQSCEAIFTDVKAKSLAYAFVLAGETCHEIWMNVTTADGLLQHLNRYIITEDVTIEAVAGDYSTFSVMGPQAKTIAAAVTDQTLNEFNTCCLNDAVSSMCCEWNQQPVVITSVPAESGLDFWQRLNSDATSPSGEWLFDHQRICEGIPVFGQDITSDNLAPEAGRNTQAISYTKGCYLGQEPIARIDAMGHVNKQIFKCLATPANAAEGSPPVALTSVSQIETDSSPALTMLMVKAVTSGENIFAKNGGGKIHLLKVKQSD